MGLNKIQHTNKQRNNTHTAKNNLKDMSWAAGFLSIFSSLPCHALACRCWLTGFALANSDFSSCSKLHSPLSHPQAGLSVHLLQGQAVAPHVLLQLLSWSYRLPVCNFSLPSSAGGRRLQCTSPCAASLPLCSPFYQPPNKTGKIQIKTAAAQSSWKEIQWVKTHRVL